MIDKLKKSLSFFLIFLTLFNISFQLTLEPFFRGADAANTEYSDLVTVFVEDAVWRSAARGVINRYANDVSRNLENTKVVLVPVPNDATAFKIASINEKFYFEGVDGDRNLVGSVFIGDIPIPVVHDNDDFSRTVFPYVDFRDKAYIYNQISEKYEKNDKRLGEVKAEIWHGFISPNSSQYSKVEGIINYFEKNHQFYAGEGAFDPLNGIMSGNKGQLLHPEYEPEVFYFDQVRESNSLNYSSYKGYLAYQNNKEDLIYNRFTKPFAEYLQTQVLGKDQEDVEGLLENVIEANQGGAKAEQAGELISALSEMDPVDSTGLGNPNVGDIQARNTILDVGKKFVEAFAPGMTGIARTNVRNTGRYSNTGSQVNMDTIPFLISHLDSITDSLIKSVNTKLEGEIDTLVMTGGLSRNIAVPTKIAQLTHDGFDALLAPENTGRTQDDFQDVTLGCFGNEAYSYNEFTNFLDGTKGNYINTAAECNSLYGSTATGSQLVDANRGININHIGNKAGDASDISVLEDKTKTGNPTADITEFLEIQGIPTYEGDAYRGGYAGLSEITTSRDIIGTAGYFGGNTPLFLDIDTGEPGYEAPGADERILQLKDGNDKGSSLVSVRDIRGAALVEENETTDDLEYPNQENNFNAELNDQTPSPLQCLQNNYILTRSKGILADGARLAGGLEYPDEMGMYEKNFYFWDNEKDRPFSEVTDKDLGLLSPELAGATVYAFDRGNPGLNCPFNYSVPIEKPLIERTRLVGFGNAFVAQNLGEDAFRTSYPITTNFGLPTTRWREDNHNHGGNAYQSDTTGTQNWNENSRNLKFDFNPGFDYVYRQIHENLAEECEYSSAYLFGNKEIFKTEEQREKFDAAEATMTLEQRGWAHALNAVLEGYGLDVWRDFPPADPEVENTNKFSSGLLYLKSRNRTFSGGYLNSEVNEITGKEGSSLISQTLEEEEVLGELVKTNMKHPAEDHPAFKENAKEKMELMNELPNEYDPATELFSCYGEADIVNYFYKEIPSYVEHKAPGPYELYSQIKHKVTPNLPVDRDRYIDFIAANNTYQKILYPYLFRLELGELETIEGTIDEKLAIVDEKLKELLDDKSDQINEVIINSNPESLTDPVDLEIYEHLKVADFPEEEIDLYQILKDLEPTEIESFLDIKEVNYYDFLVFAIYWNNIASVPGKYKFIMEQYLSDQYKRPELEFLLPKNKKTYEMAYLGAPGTAKEMYVSLDPEAKSDNPFADIIYDNVELGSQLFSSNVYENTGEGADFECAPPEGVPLWEWPSALSCWLDGFQKPGIDFSPNACSQKTLFLTPDEQEAMRDCGGDFNKNGIEDCVEESVPDGRLELYSESPVYFYNTTGKITVSLKGNEGNTIKYDSTSRINLELIDIQAKDGSQIIDTTEYVRYSFQDTRNSYGEANFYFTGKDKDVDLFFKASLELQDSNGEVFATLESSDLKVEIRGDKMFGTSYKFTEEENDLGLQIGQDRIRVSGYTNVFVSDELYNPLAGKEDQVSEASLAKEKMVFSLSNYDGGGENIDLNYPISVKVYKGVNEFQDDDEQIHSEYLVEGPGGLVPIASFTETGLYKFVFTDAYGVNYSRVIELVPDVVAKMEMNLTTNVSETGRVHTPHIVSLYDEYGNLTSGEFYTMIATISGDGVTFDDITKEKIFTSYEGFQAFKLISENGGGKSTITFRIDGVEVSEEFFVVEDIDIIVEPQFDKLVVGGGIYSYDVRVQGAGSDVDNLNTSLYVAANDTYLEPLSPLFQIIDGRAQVKIITKKSSGRDIPIEFQAYGLRDSYKENQTIFHEQAIKIDVSLSKDKIEANPESSSFLTVELKDRFGNVAFSDNESDVFLELKDKVSRFFSPEDIDTPAGEHLSSESGESRIIEPDDLSKTVNEGRAIFKLSGKEEPGLSYFKVLVPSIEGTSFVVNGQAPFSQEDLDIEGFRSDTGLSELGTNFFDDLGDGQIRSKYLYFSDLQGSNDFQNLSPALANRLSAVFSLNNQMTITGVGENAGMIETYYFWKSEKIQEKYYNALYTTMVGSNYGDINEEDYLAGGILFEKENRGLVVTSLLQNPYKTDAVFRIGKESSLRKVASNEDLAQDVIPSLVITDDSTRVTLNNESINVNIGDVYYNFDSSSTELITCEIGEDIDACADTTGSTEIVLREVSRLYNVINRDNALRILNTSGEEIFSIDSAGLIEKDIGVQLQVDFDSREKFLKIDIATANGEAGILYFNFNDEALLNVTRDASRLGALNSVKNSIVFYSRTNYYDAKPVDGTGIEVSYRDLFKTSKSLENFVEDTPYGYENYDKEGGIGFTGTNKTLLSFAAGKSVGEATKDYHSFYMINLGDPVVSLKKIPKKLPFSEENRNFDSTLGEIITREDGVVDYSVEDYNNDGRPDIFIQKNTGYIKLLENTSGATKFMDRGNLLYIADISSSSVAQAGDFDGNGFGDVFIVNTKGQGAVFMNDQKKYTRYDLEDQFALNGKITQAEVFDMNADGKHDVVVLDESGEINIFYGGGSADAPAFTKRTIEEGLGATLLEDVRTAGAALYFDGLPQNSGVSSYEALSQSQEERLNQVLAGQEVAAEEAIDFESFCFQNDECKSQVLRIDGTRILSKDPTEVCKGIDSCMQLAVNDILGQSIALGDSEIPLSESDVSSALFTDLPYATSELYNEERESLTNEEVSALISENFPIFSEETHPDVQAGVDITDQNIANFISSANPDSISFDGELNDTEETTFIHSQYAEQAGIRIQKYYSDSDGGYLKSGDNIEAKIILTNISDDEKTNMAFVDSFPSGFILDTGRDVFTSIDGLDMKSGIATYDYLFEGFSMGSGDEVTFVFGLKAPPIRVGYMEVGIFEDVGGGNDGKGDVKIKSSKNTCGISETLYMSPGYGKSEEIPSCDTTRISPDLEEHLTDNDDNGVPDYIDALLEGEGGVTNARTQYAEEQLLLLDQDSDLDGLPDRNDDSPNQNTNDLSFLDELNSLDESAALASEQIDTLIAGLGCGFGGGGCIANPLNWAPLAPGNDPTLFGMPVGDGTHINEGIPVFSALTGIILPFVGCVPFIWPPSPLDHTKGCSMPGAGGYLGTTNPTNFFRIFVTPTLTGSAGVAICFGPAQVAGYLNPPGVHPLVPGGNCIVTAMPLPLCSNDGSDGDPSYIGRPESVAGSDYSVIGGSCETVKAPAQQIDPAIVTAYMERVNSGGAPTQSFAELLLEQVTEGNIAQGEYWQQSNDTPLIQGGEGDDSFDLGFSITGEDGFSFQDVQKINMKKVFPFPDFLAGWLDRQIGEISDKLTDFPGLFIILPDFSGFMQGGWGNFTDDLEEHYAQGKELYDVDQAAVNDAISRLDEQKADLGCDPEGSRRSITIRCNLIDIRIAKLRRDNGMTGGILSEASAVVQKGRGQMSGIKAAYQFLGSLPLISVEPEKVLVTLPWIDEGTVSRAVIDRKQTKNQWKKEIAGSREELSNLDENFDIQASRLLSSVDKNIEIIEHYAELPGEINKLLRVKELRLEQITCNIDAINEMLNGRIDRNGKRFKAWVELYITIKAILKSWQLLIDIFYEYDAACHECKNERQDLYYFAFSLISVVIPEIPVIQFPRWPDVILDLHNIKAGIVVSLPDIEIRPRPIVLPPLPTLNLPSAPNVAVQLPALPLLEDYTIPELPELPSLPVVDLPDLPPPPKLPKLFAELEGMLSILKLITKVMCILKSSPFVPEWRAGDQIAFITERTGYLSTDFIDLKTPQFSYPFVDAIKVTSYVNFEYETDFLIEATRSALLPFNTFTSDVSKKINRLIPDFNLENLDQYEIDDINVGFDQDLNLQSELKNDRDFMELMSFSAAGIKGLVSYIDEHANEEVESRYFTKLVNESLNKKWIIKDPKYNDLRALWLSVQDYDYSEEDNFIDALKETHSQKFDTLKQIIDYENQVNEKQKQELQQLQEKNLGFHNNFTLISGEKNRFDQYQTQLNKYNEKAKNAYLSVIQGNNSEKESLKTLAQEISESMEEGIQDHARKLALTQPDTLFAADNSSNGSPEATGGTCVASHADHIDYKGIYILEEGTSYRLFDYLEEVDGDEEHRYIDFDTDGDQDIIYTMNGVMYLKENLEIQGAQIYSPGVENSNFEEMDEKFEAINGFRGIVENGYVNITFNAHTNRDVNGYRLEFYDRIDAFDSEESQNPDDYQKVIIDSFARIDELTLEGENDFYTTRKNVGRVTNASFAPGLEVEVDEVVDLATLLTRNNLVQITKGTRLYTGRGSGGIRYYFKSDDTKTEKSITLDSHSNIEFLDNIVVIGTLGSIYTRTKVRRIYDGSDVIDLVRLPLLPDTIVRLEDDGRVLSDGSNMEITYYDDTTLGLDFSLLKKYELVDLGPEQEEYFIKTSMENAFYYARFTPFLGNEFGTAVSTVLMAPQKEIDSTPPELDYSAFRIPVYKEREFDLTPYIYDDTGIRGIVEMYIDSDLEVDSDGNGDPADDRSVSAEGIVLQRSAESVKISFGPYDELFRKDFKIIMIDENDNIGEKIVEMEVYAPIPDITYGDTTTVRGLLREKIEGEPITLFRYRGGVLSKLRDISGATQIFTGLNGDFKFAFPVEESIDTEPIGEDEGSGLEQAGVTNEGGNTDQSSEQSETDNQTENVQGEGAGGGEASGGEDDQNSQNGVDEYAFMEDNGLTIINNEDNSIIARVDGDTGQVTVEDPITSIRVLAVNDPENISGDQEGEGGDTIIKLERAGEEVYTQSIAIEGGYNHIVPNFENLGVEGIYTRLLDPTLYGIYQIPHNADYSPGAVVIYYLDDPLFTPLFRIFKDGRIYVKDENYRIEYANYEEYITLNLVDLIKERVPAEVLVKPGEEFTLQ